MNSKKLNILLIVLLVIAIVIIAFLLIKMNVHKSSEVENVTKEESSILESIDEKEVVEEKLENTVTDNKTSGNVSSPDEIKQVENYTDKDTTVIEEFNKLEASTTSVLKSADKEDAKSTVKGVFISIVDFLFYDGEIKGITFSELSDAGKEKVLEIASSIDSKIESKFPGYKNTISDKTSNAYTKASEIIKKGASNLSEFSKDKLGEENYNSIIDAKDELVTYTKFSFNIVKSVGSSIYDKVTDKISNWYENFKNGE